MLLVVLTEATLVSQISRAGSLLSEHSGFLLNQDANTLVPYRIGCILAAAVGAVLSFAGKEKESNSTEQATSSANDITEEMEASPSRSLATNSNALLTTTFLASAILLFKTGSSTADWSRCFVASSASKPLVPSISAATPTMLQLLTYGEILPNVCSMLRYHTPSVRRAIIIGSTIPLVLLSGWAALGVALLPTNLAASPLMQDPVDVLIASGSGSIRSRLLLLAASAIGTTILGCFLALESAYNDLVVPETANEDATLSQTRLLPIQKWRQSRVVKALTIVLPPLAISAISPTVFLRAIDFAGSYPVLLLWGVLPPLMALRILYPKGKSINGEQKSRRTSNMTIKPFVCIFLGLLSAAMIGVSSIRDIGKLALLGVG